jgi:hypothetical protein
MQTCKCFHWVESKDKFWGGKLQSWLGFVLDISWKVDLFGTHTRPDLAYAASVVSQFMHDLGVRHMQVVCRVLQYRKDILGRGLLFKRSGSLTMETYTDDDYAGLLSNRRSTSGYCTFFCGNLVA